MEKELEEISEVREGEGRRGGGNGRPGEGGGQPRTDRQADGNRQQDRMRMDAWLDATQLRFAVSASPGRTHAGGVKDAHPATPKHTKTSRPEGTAPAQRNQQRATTKGKGTGEPINHMPEESNSRQSGLPLQSAAFSISTSDARCCLLCLKTVHASCHRRPARSSLLRFLLDHR
jgi:hypothetical protein